MCAELEKWSKEERAEGWEAGLAKGHAKGHAEGRAEGHAEGRAEERLVVAKALLRKHMSVEDIAEVTGLSVKEITQMT